MKIIARQLIEEIKACKELPEAMKRLLIDFVRMMSNMEDAIKAVSAVSFHSSFINDSELEINNPSYFTKLLGYEAEDKHSFTFDDFMRHLHAEDVPYFRQMMSYFCNNKGSYYSGVFRMKHSSGGTVWLFGRAYMAGMDEMTGKPVISGVLIEFCDKFYTPEQLDMLNKKFLHLKTESMLHMLTHHEICVAELLSHGLTSEEIAEKLNISPSTVNIHKNNLFHKTETKNSAHLMRFLFTRGLL